jgi:CubicO group peptidase (beta-lactamase class C family)
MFQRLAIATGLLLLLTGAPARAQVLVYEVFGAFLDSLREQAGIPGLAAAIVDNGGITWERAYGAQDIARFVSARTDTPFHAGGLTQTITAAMALSCEEQRRLSLDDTLTKFGFDGVEPDVSLRQLLTHTSGPSGNLTYAHRPERLAPLWPILRACTVDSYRETFANLLARLAMTDSVPGANIIHVVPPEEGVPVPEDIERYTAVLQRRATPYSVDGRGRATVSRYPDAAGVLTPSSGLITTVRDLAKFDVALKQGLLVAPATLAAAWSPPAGNSGLPLPHGIGWFVQQYNGEKVVWQFGMTENASSSLMITLPARGITLILMANSDGLVKLYSPTNGDVTLSPFARLFLNMFIR